MSNNSMNGNGKRSYKLMIVDDSNLMRRRIERSQQFEELQLVGSTILKRVNLPGWVLTPILPPRA